VNPLKVLVALATILLQANPDAVHRSKLPTYELTLPPGYDPTLPRETIPRYTRRSGRESWAVISVIILDNKSVLPQDPTGAKVEATLPSVILPPEAKWTFVPRKWKDFEIGTIEYRAVVKDLLVIGLAAVVPLGTGTVTITVQAPETFEKDCREDLQQMLQRMEQAPSHWHPPEHFQKIQSLARYAWIGAGLVALYLIVWFLFLKGRPMIAHWPRTAWMVIAAVMLFIPIHSPGETSLESNLLVNAVMPAVMLLFAARRIKMGIEE